MTTIAESMLKNHIVDSPIFSEEDKKRIVSAGFPPEICDDLVNAIFSEDVEMAKRSLAEVGFSL